jgi:hypothetical protein
VPAALGKKVMEALTVRSGVGVLPGGSCCRVDDDAGHTKPPSGIPGRAAGITEGGTALPAEEGLVEDLIRIGVAEDASEEIVRRRSMGDDTSRCMTVPTSACRRG